MPRRSEAIRCGKCAKDAVLRPDNYAYCKHCGWVRRPVPSARGLVCLAGGRDDAHKERLRKQVLLAETLREAPCWPEDDDGSVA